MDISTIKAMTEQWWLQLPAIYLHSCVTSVINDLLLEADELDETESVGIRGLFNEINTLFNGSEPPSCFLYPLLPVFMTHQDGFSTRNR